MRLQGDVLSLAGTGRSHPLVDFTVVQEIGRSDVVIAGPGWQIRIYRETFRFTADVEIPGLTEIRGWVTEEAEQFGAVAATLLGEPADVEFAGHVFLQVHAVDLSEERCDFVSSGVVGMTPARFEEIDREVYPS